MKEFLSAMKDFLSSFTLIEKMIAFLIISCVIAIAVGSSYTAKETKVQAPTNFSILSEKEILPYIGIIQIVEDKTTKQQYIVVQGKGLFITPRLPAKE